MSDDALTGEINICIQAIMLRNSKGNEISLRDAIAAALAAERQAHEKERKELERQSWATSSLRKELAAAESTITEWQKAMIGLTPGGSEFVGDPTYCASYLREKLNTHADIAKKAIVAQRAAESTRDAAIARIAALEAAMNPQDVQEATAHLEQAQWDVVPNSAPQTSGPQCKKCGAFTTYARVNSHGLCMKCETEQ